ncbi:MAG: glycoside hydrolase family 3 C-terminal domain-containing protein, partial [Blautia sp.]|nr:glycoside hydrolase family 3 C-terminal domain-containing protein [Blautia sp.]
MKQRMNNKKFRLILTPILCLFVIFAIVVTSVTNYFTSSLDTFLGKGARSATRPGGTSGWNADYYDFETTGQEDALMASAKVAEQIADEGEILLKNDGLLPLTKDTPVTPFGYRYVDPVMSGSGSGGTNTTADYVYNAEKGIQEAFSNINQKAVDAMKAGQAVDTVPAGAGGEAGQTAFLGSSATIREYPADVFAGIEDSCKGTVGLVFIGRAGGEGGDIYTLPYTDGTPHQLALTEIEREVLSFAKANCDGVVVILNCCNAMEVSELEDDK